MPQTAAKISVITVNWNRKEDTIECLESVYKSDYADFDVIVVDNGSGDSSVEAIAKRFPKAAIIANKTNTGFCAAANAAVKKAMMGGAGCVFIVNNDMVIAPTALRELRAALDADPSIGAVGPVQAYYSDPGVLQFKGSSIDWGNGDLFGRYGDEDLKSGAVLDSDIASWGAALITKEAIEKAGYLDERLFMYYDDIDWSVRCRRSGLKTALYAKPLVFHKGSSSSGGPFSPTFYFYFTRNKALFFRNDAPVIRKLQFVFNYAKLAYANHERLLGRGDRKAADAALDGLWSGLHGCIGEERLPMPDRLKKKIGFTDKVYLAALTLKAVFL